MRVLLVTNMYPSPRRPHFGTFVHDEVEALRGLGVEMDVLFADGQRHTLNYVAGMAAVLGRSLGRQRYDLVHAHYVLSGVLARCQLRWPLVLTLHGSEVAVGWTPPLSRALARLADWVIVTSPRVLDDLHMNLPHVAVIPCGIDLDLFTPGEQAAARAALGLPAERQLVVFVGEPRPEKQVHLLEGAVARLQAAGQPVDLLIASGQPHERVPLFMQAADVLGLTSSYEGSPMVIKEAMACNLPIVATDVGDVAGVIRDTAGCYLAAPTVESVTDKLASALAFGGRTDGRSRIRHLSGAAAAQQVLAVYHEVLR
ncbi:MAG: glycosyltransferase [Anaerolineae bacterium]